MNTTNLSSPLTLSRDERPKPLADFPVVYVQAVAWGEMDAFNHVNNVAYYRYAESARIAYLYQLKMFKEATLTILAASSCNYLRPVTYPDTLLIGVKCQNIGNTSLTMSYEFFSTAQSALVATAQSTIVRTDMNGKKQPWSDEERQQIERFELAR
ncbi:MAG: thioesterase family protein [Moraxella sp.]|nr:thioesterase family protein [Moraxella sp.]